MTADKSRPIIFLDIDGVLIPARRMAQRSPDLTCVRNLNMLAEATEATIVVSSTWRNAGLGRITSILQGWGVAATIVGSTPELAVERDSGLLQAVARGEEIQAWLAHHPHETFVILDDEGGMGDLEPYWVQVDGETGLAATDVIRAVEMLSQ